MISKIRKWISKINIFKRLKDAELLISGLKESNYILKGQLMTRRKTMISLVEDMKTLKKEYDDLTLKLETVEMKKRKASVVIAQLVNRRDEFLSRLAAPVPSVDIDNFADYKYWISEPFIVEKYDIFTSGKDVDTKSVLKGLDTIFKNVDGKKKIEEESNPS
jgi:hypothetical protein